MRIGEIACGKFAAHRVLLRNMCWLAEMEPYNVLLTEQASGAAPLCFRSGSTLPGLRSSLFAMEILE